MIEAVLLHPAAQRALEAEYARIRGLWDPPRDVTVSQWAERYRLLGKENSGVWGQWRSRRFQVDIMDAFNDPEVREVVVMKSTQLGLTEILNNVIGYIIDVDPGPTLMVRPTGDDAKKHSQQRVEPMIQACPVLRARVRPALAKRSGNQLRFKEFPGGFLKITGANSGSGLRSDPIRYLLLDEVDGYPDDVNKEGDPVQIVLRRTDTFANYKVMFISTPAKARGHSRIEKLFLQSDQRIFHVPCPLCGFMQRLSWRDPKTQEFRLLWEKNASGEPIPESVCYLCSGCRGRIEERHKPAMVEAGRWVATFPERRDRAGFHINALYSPWKENWADLARQWVRAQNNPEELRAFVNLQLGETWIEQEDAAQATELQARRRAYPAGVEVPEGVGALIMTVDVQDRWLEAVVTGFGVGEQSWLVAHERFDGDPGAGGADVADSVWSRVEQLRLRRFKCARGRMLAPMIVLIDSGGHHTDAVYDYVLPRQNGRDCVFALKGVKYHTKPVLVMDGAVRRRQVRLFTVATDWAKDRIASRLKLPTPCPGYFNFPDWTTDEYLAQITGEQKTSVIDRRTKQRRWMWVKTHGRNEALDLAVYALAGLHVLQETMRRSRDLEAGALELASPPPQGEPPPPPPRRGGGGWGSGGGTSSGGWVGNY